MKKRDLVFLSLVTFTLLAVYSRSFRSELTWDDALYFKNNLLLTEHKPLTEAFKTGYFSEQMGFKGIDHYYRPLLTASFMAESKLWGIHPATLRIVNLLLFIACLSILYFLLKRLSAGTLVPEIAVLLFALHPVNADNIIWVVGRGDLLLLFFGALAFLCLEISSDKGKGPRWLAGSAFFLLGMFSKESFLLFWPALLAFDWSRRRKINIPFHALNLLSVFLFFVTKGAVLGIKNPRVLSLFSLGDSFRVALGTVGYYFKAVLWPLPGRLFLSLAEAKSIGYVALGAVAVLLLAFGAYRSFKDRALAAPVALAACFLAGHVGMAFSSSFPYTIYARYVMVAWVGAAWILALLIGRLKEKIRLYPVFALLLIFVPATYFSTRAYKTELTFWQTAAARAPKDGYVLYQLANAQFGSGDIIGAELVLNHALSLSLRRETAMVVSQLYEKVDFAKADYVGAHKWLDSIEEIASRPNIAMAEPMRFQVRLERAKLVMSEGDSAAAEKYLRENIMAFPEAEVSYTDLFDVYVGAEMWDKAREIEKELRRRFPSCTASAEKIEGDFKAAALDSKIFFYIHYRNFGRAANLLKESGPLDLARTLFLARLLYAEGDPTAGAAVVMRLAVENAGHYQVMNSIAAFYLKDLNRVTEAVAFLKKSLALNPDQPQIRSVADNFTVGFLDKIKPVWK